MRSKISYSATVTQWQCHACRPAGASLGRHCSRTSLTSLTSRSWSESTFSPASRDWKCSEIPTQKVAFICCIYAFVRQVCQEHSGLKGRLNAYTFVSFLTSFTSCGEFLSQVLKSRERRAFEDRLYCLYMNTFRLVTQWHTGCTDKRFNCRFDINSAMEIPVGTFLAYGVWFVQFFLLVEFERLKDNGLGSNCINDFN